MKKKLVTVLVLLLSFMLIAPAAAGTRLSKARIKKLANSKVKNATITQVTLDVDDGVEEYDVTMKKGKKIYKLSYAADTGKLKEYQWKVTGAK